MALGPLRPPLPQRRPVDIFSLSQTLALPEIARQQAAAAKYQGLADLPQNLINTKIMFDQLRRNQEDYQPVEKVAPGLVIAFPELSGVPFARAREILPSLARQRAASAIRPESPLSAALKQTLLEQRKKAVENLENPPPKPLTPKQVEVIGDLEASIENVQKLTAEAPIHAASLGPFNARAYEGKIGNAAVRIFGNPEFRAFKSKVGRAYDRYRKLITGAQAAFPEITLLQTRFPQTVDPEEQFLSIAKGLSSELQDKKAILKGILEQQNQKYPKIGGPSAYSFSNPAQVGKALMDGKINEEEAADLLKTKFGYTP